MMLNISQYNLAKLPVGLFWMKLKVYYSFVTFVTNQKHQIKDLLWNINIIMIMSQYSELHCTS